MWLRIDDNLPDHPKFATLDPLATALWLYGLCYAGRFLTNGRIPKSIAIQLASRVTAQQSLLGESTLIQKLVSCRLWAATENGYRVHNYLRYNPSRRKVLAERRTARLRRQKVRQERVSADAASGERRATSQKDSPVNDPTRPDPSRPVLVNNKVLPATPQINGQSHAKIRPPILDEPSPEPRPIPEPIRQQMLQTFKVGVKADA